MPNSLRNACSSLAAPIASLRQALSQPVSRMRSGAPALAIQSRCSFSDALMSPCSAVARGFVFEATALPRKRATQSKFFITQSGSQRSAALVLVRYDGNARHSDGLLSGRIEPLERTPALP